MIRHPSVTHKSLLADTSCWPGVGMNHSECAQVSAWVTHHWLAFVPADAPPYSHGQQVTGIAVILGLVLAVAVAVLIANGRGR